MSGYRTTTVAVPGGDLTVGLWGEGTPSVLAVHGITGSHLSWGAVAARFAATGGSLAAVDLRGRGRSGELPGPYGMAAHARDCAAVLDALGMDRAVVAGHSMGAFVSLVLGDLYPGKVERILLVDGGPPLPVAPGRTPDEQVADAIGPAAARLRMRFADREANRDFWRAHPAFKVWTPAIEAYVDYDMTGEEPELRSRVSLDAVSADSADLLTGDALAGAWRRLRGPTEMLRAGRGMLDEPVPLYPDPAPIAARIPVRTLPDANHYTILLGDAPSAEVAAALSRMA
ncbi:alpha/beta fold hydrolase [Actinomadura montaniterrae]|uniref:Alpha/beta hydrolase n=1 Tax=Actinomadura montaniterrae TaxID=1803903 RepID=A0A6L3VWG9_9ACTN|nr:alpha/beta hydrolase [Actinomadura montaniterrae]KAB2379335.1 alpha/beta hydrolase [Actinomadura montaniterrae]